VLSIGANGLLVGTAQELGMEIVASFLHRFLFFNFDAMSVLVGIVTHARHLPRNLTASLAAAYFETVLGDFLGEI
jgi:hypothetical protein